MNWFDIDTISPLAVKLLLDVAITFIIVMLIYRPRQQSSDYTFTFFIFNILIFFICHMMIGLDQASIGFGFGLFALFSIMRYRTSTIRIKDMTYLFAVVCIAVINALASNNFSVFELVFINLTVVGSIYFLEIILFKDNLIPYRINYEDVEMIKPRNKEKLLADIEERIGRKVEKIDIESINYLNDSAVLWVYFKASTLKEENENQSVKVELKSKINGSAVVSDPAVQETSV